MNFPATTSQPRRHLMTSSQKRDVITDRHSTTARGVLDNRNHDDDVVNGTTSAANPPATNTASGDRATEMTSSRTTGSGDRDTPPVGRSTDYGGDSVAVVVAICACLVALVLVLTTVVAVIVRYVACSCSEST